MIVMDSRQWIWVAEHRKTGKLAWWTATTEERLVKKSMEQIKNWKMNADEYQIAAFSLQRELGNEPDEKPSYIGNLYINADGSRSGV